MSTGSASSEERSWSASDHAWAVGGITAPACRGPLYAPDMRRSGAGSVGCRCVLADQVRGCFPPCAADCQTCTPNYGLTARWLRRTDGPMVALDPGWAVGGPAMSGESGTFCRPRTAGCSGG